MISASCHHIRDALFARRLFHCLLLKPALKLITQAIQAELDEVLKQFADQQTIDGKHRVVCNGYQPERELLTGISKVQVKVPKIRSREGEPVSFHALLVPTQIIR